MASGEGSAYIRESIEFTVKGPIPLFCEEEKKNISGSSIIDIHLSKSSRIGELVFRNFYTASITILAQLEKENEQAQTRGKRNPWLIAIRRKILMPLPHLEEGSNDLFSISATESTIPLDRVVVLRIILRQPSPHWSVFKLEEINLYSVLPRLAAPSVERYESQRVLELMRKQTMLALTTLPENDENFTNSCKSLPIPSDSNLQAIPYEIIKLPLTS